MAGTNNSTILDFKQRKTKLTENKLCREQFTNAGCASDLVTDLLLQNCPGTLQNYAKEETTISRPNVNYVYMRADILLRHTRLLQSFFSLAMKGSFFQ